MCRFSIHQTALGPRHYLEELCAGTPTPPESFGPNSSGLSWFGEEDVWRDWAETMRDLAHDEYDREFRDHERPQ